MSTKLETYRKMAVKKHNELRKKHGARALKCSERLEKMAQEWADHLAYNNMMQHRPQNGRDGENLAMSSGDKYGGCYDATQMWYNEISMYNFNSGGFSMSTGHFTAMVWRETTHIGIGVARNNGGNWYVVANYYPCGNVQGAFRNNVWQAATYEISDDEEEVERKKAEDFRSAARTLKSPPSVPQRPEHAALEKLYGQSLSLMDEMMVALRPCGNVQGAFRNNVWQAATYEISDDEEEVERKKAEDFRSAGRPLKSPPSVPQRPEHAALEKLYGQPLSLMDEMIVALRAKNADSPPPDDPHNRPNKPPRPPPAKHATIHQKPAEKPSVLTKPISVKMLAARFDAKSAQVDL